MGKIKKSALWVFEQLFDKNNIDLKNKVLLDIGGGSAGLGFYYSSILNQYYCVDPYQGNGNPKENYNNALKKIQSNNISNMKILKMDLETFKKKNHEVKFDIVLLSNSLHHIFKNPVNKIDLDNFFNIVESLLKSGGVLLIKESLPINLSQIFPKLNVDGVLWSDKFYPSFWLKVIEENNTYQKINCHYQVPFKLKLFFPIIKFSNILRMISAYISSSSYIIKAYKK